MIARARWSTYLAVAGWVVAILLGVLLAAMWAQAHPIETENATPPEPPAPPGEAPHVIL